MTNQISLSNTSVAPIRRAYDTLNQNGAKKLQASIVPLKCGKGGACNALIEEDKEFQTEVTELVKNSKKKIRSMTLLFRCRGGQ